MKMINPCLDIDTAYLLRFPKGSPTSLKLKALHVRMVLGTVNTP